MGDLSLFPLVKLIWQAYMKGGNAWKAIFSTCLLGAIPIYIIDYDALVPWGIFWLALYVITSVYIIISCCHNYKNGCFDRELLDCIKRHGYGRLAIIPETKIYAYLLRDKKNDFQIFDYDGGLIISFLNNSQWKKEPVNIRYEYKDITDFILTPVGTFRKQLGMKWGKRLIVDLNDPDYKEKYFARLREAEEDKKK